MTLGPDEIRSYDEVRKVTPYHETEAFRSSEGRMVGGYHEHQGFNAFGANNPIHYHNVSGIENKGPLTPQEQEREEREKGKKLTINHHFSNAASGITPLTAVQNSVLSAVMGNLQISAENSIDPERAMEVAQETQGLIEQSEEMAADVKELNMTSLKNPDGTTVMTKADFDQGVQEGRWGQMTPVQLTQEEINEGLNAGKGQELTGEMERFKTFDQIINPDHVTPLQSPALVQPKGPFDNFSG